MITKIFCDENSCTIRYYIGENKLSDGLIRAKYTRNGKTNMPIITIVEMRINNILPHFDDVMALRADCVEKIKEHLG
jgi:hypothetical protein